MMTALHAAVAQLSPQSRALLRARIDANLAWRAAHRRFECLYSDTGPLRRELFAKSVQFFKAGASYLERGLFGGNRSGKSTTAAYELTCHLTGRYPHWWEGRRFDRPITAWAAGDDGKTVRETIQATLFGELGAPGTGLIPSEAIVSTTKRSGVAEAIDAAVIQRADGGYPRLLFKSYDQQRESFQGARVDVGWCDEEPPANVYTEFLTRLLSTVPGEPSGTMLCTFTPLRGLSEIVLRFLPGGKPVAGHSRHVTFVSWDDAAHLSREEKERLIAAYLPNELDARTKGIPSLGAGAIYPVPESDIVCEPFELPAWYRCAYALDVGWNRTAAVWGALDYESDTLFLYSEYYRGQAEPPIHAQAIKARGEWIPGVIDPAARGRSQKDGAQLLRVYQDLGLSNLTVASNAVESGIYSVWSRLSIGKLKVFSTLQNWLAEFRIYRRDENGKVVKENDHLMDCTRYLVLSGIAQAAAKPSTLWTQRDMPAGVRRSGHEWEYDSSANSDLERRR